MKRNKFITAIFLTLCFNLQAHGKNIFENNIEDINFFYETLDNFYIRFTCKRKISNSNNTTKTITEFIHIGTKFRINTYTYKNDSYLESIVYCFDGIKYYEKESDQRLHISKNINNDFIKPAIGSPLTISWLPIFMKNQSLFMQSFGQKEFGAMLYKSQNENISSDGIFQIEDFDGISYINIKSIGFPTWERKRYNKGYVSMKICSFKSYTLNNNQIDIPEKIIVTSFNPKLNNEVETETILNEFKILDTNNSLKDDYFSIDPSEVKYVQDDDYNVFLKH